MIMRPALDGKGRDMIIHAHHAVNEMTMTLEQHAAAYWKDRGIEYYAHGQTDRENLYETWAEWAFRDLHG
jgi:hypothetical protein